MAQDAQEPRSRGDRGSAGPGLRWRQAAWAGAMGPDVDVQRASMWVRPRASTTGTHRMVSPEDVSDSLMRHLLFMFCSPSLALPHLMRETAVEYGEFAPFRSRRTARRAISAPRPRQLAAAAAQARPCERSEKSRVNKRQVAGPTREQTTGRPSRA